MQTAELESVLERAREGLEALAVSTAELEETLPEKVGAAVRDGIGSEARPVARQLAEVRGLMNQVLRRLPEEAMTMRSRGGARAIRRSSDALAITTKLACCSTCIAAPSS